MNTFSRIISFVFHPLLMPTYVVATLGWAFPEALFPIQPQSFRSVVLLIFFMTFLLPVLNLYFFKLFGTISSLTLRNRHERTFPFVFIAILYSIVTYMFYYRLHVGFNDNLIRLLLGVNLLVVVATVTTFFYKISIHALAIGGAVGIFLALYLLNPVGILYDLLIAGILTGGVILSARLQLQAHSLSEILWGGAAGLLAGSIVWIHG